MITLSAATACTLRAEPQSPPSSPEQHRADQAADHQHQRRRAPEPQATAAAATAAGRGPGAWRGCCCAAQQGFHIHILVHLAEVRLGACVEGKEREGGRQQVVAVRIEYHAPPTSATWSQQCACWWSCWGVPGAGAVCAGAAPVLPPLPSPPPPPPTLTCGAVCHLPAGLAAGAAAAAAAALLPPSPSPTLTC
jgi:hypothetical protein